MKKKSRLIFIFILAFLSQMGFSQGKIWRSIALNEYPNNVYLPTRTSLINVIVGGMLEKKITPYRYNNGFADFAESYFYDLDAFYQVLAPFRYKEVPKEPFIYGIELQEYYYPNKKAGEKYDIQALVITGKKKGGKASKILCKYSEVATYLKKAFAMRGDKKEANYEEWRAFWQSPIDHTLQTSYNTALETRQFNSQITKHENLSAKQLRRTQKQSNAYKRRQKTKTLLKPYFFRVNKNLLRTTLLYQVDFETKENQYLSKMVTYMLADTYKKRLQAYQYEPRYIQLRNPLHPEELPARNTIATNKVQLVCWQEINPNTGTKLLNIRRIDFLTIADNKPVFSFEFRDLIRTLIPYDFVEKLKQASFKGKLLRFSNPENLSVRNIWEQKVKPRRYPRRENKVKLERCYQRALRRTEKRLAK